MEERDFGTLALTPAAVVDLAAPLLGGPRSGELLGLKRMTRIWLV